MDEFQPYRHKVRYYETDQMGVVHHSNYIRWFEDARTDLLERNGFSYHRMEEIGIIIPVLAAECEYLQAVKYGEIVRIVPTLTSYTGLRMSLAYKVLDDATGALRATGSTRHCFLDVRFKPAQLKKNHPEADEFFRRLLTMHAGQD